MGCSPRGCWESDTTERLPFHFSLSCIGEGNGNPLQCSCLENPRDEGVGVGASWAAVYGVTQSWTLLKRLSSSSRESWIYIPTLLFTSCMILDFPILGFPGGTSSKEPVCYGGEERDAGSITRSGRSPGGSHGNPIQYSCLENPTDKGAWWATVHGVTKSQT